VPRARDDKDRRFITARITEEGLRLLASLDQPLAECHKRQIGHLGEARLASLGKLLDVMRDRER
jgi:DNA-binding MarR family transcriptional regulator